MRTAFWMFALAASAAAQTATLTAVAPITVTASVGLQSQTSTLPAGPVSLPITLLASVPPSGGETANAQVSWGVGSSETQLDVVFQQFASLASVGSPGFVHIGPTDWRVALTNPSPIAVTIEVVKEGGIPAGSNQQALTVDFGDDGTNEYVFGSPDTTVLGVLGPTPWVVRVRSDTTLSGAGIVTPRTRLIVTPMAGIGIAPALLGCDPVRYHMAAPTFSGNLQMQVGFDITNPVPLVFVIGLSAQPIVLGTMPPMPCLLLPAPDLLVLLPPSPPTFLLPLPAALRPVAFFTQAVALDQLGLLTTNGFFVTAN
jgi:hypothetical protein